MNIDQFVQSDVSSDCRLLQRLYECLDREKAGPDFFIFITLLDIEPYEGTILYDDRMTPTNTLTFAKTGGDDVHFGMLSRNGRFGDDSPIIMTVPMADLDSYETNFVVGETLHDFLCLGCVHGFFYLEKLAYPWKTQLFELFARPNPSEDSSYSIFRSTLSLSPWPEIELRQQELDAQYKPLLEFRKRRKSWWKLW